MIIQTEKALFVPNEDRSDNYITEFYTEVNLSTLVIKEDRTLIPPQYTLFLEFKENKRMFRELLFSSSKKQKVINFVNEYLK